MPKWRLSQQDTKGLRGIWEGRTTQSKATRDAGRPRSWDRIWLARLNATVLVLRIGVRISFHLLLHACAERWRFDRGIGIAGRSIRCRVRRFYGQTSRPSFIVSTLDPRARRCLQRGRHLYFIALGTLEHRSTHAVSLTRCLTFNRVSSKCVCCRLQCSLSPHLFPWTCPQSPETGHPLLKVKPDGTPAIGRQG